jgi:5S rRNA maturation endonuclease (ribonuclease M5)
MKRPDGFIDVDRLQAETTFEEAAAKCGVTVEMKGTGPEQRIDCPFGCPGDHAGRKEIATNITNPQKIFQCHAYGCGFRGNLLTLMHGWTTGTKPAGGKLKGDEFQRIKRILAGNSAPQGQVKQAKAQSTAENGEANPPPARNVPLIDSADPKVRELHDIDTKFVTDIANMNPTASVYIRRHPCLTSDAMKKWRCGYLPNDGGGDKRGWSLKGCMVYPVLSETGKVLCWVGRDLQYEQKAATFSALAPAERSGSDPPAKHRFPKGFHRGNELFGQQASRLNEPGYREFVTKHGLVIVEGFNDVINLDNLGIPALGIMSNRLSDGQVDKIARWAAQLGNHRVNLMLDNDDAGVEGAKDALWQFAEKGLHVHLLWSPNMFGGDFERKQPESVTSEDCVQLISRLN